LIGNNLDLIIPNTSVPPNYQQQNKIHQNEINKLLIEKQKQKQLLQNSLGIINDPTQSKSLRRTHKQAYEASQHKIEQLNESINVLAQQQCEFMSQKSQDDIALHRSDNRFVKNALAMVGNNAKNLHMLNTNNSVMMSERRNSMKSTTSSLGSMNTFIIQSSPSSATSLNSLKTLSNVMNHSPRTRADSSVYSQNNQHQFDYDAHKNESPTPSTMSLQQLGMHANNNINYQIPLCSQSLKNIKINTENHSPNMQSYHQQQAQYSPQIQQQQFFAHSQQNMYPQQKMKQYPQPQQPQTRQVFNQQQTDQTKFIHRLHSFNHQMQHDKNFLHMASTNTINHITDDVRMKYLARQQQQQQAQQASPNHYTVSHSAGLGGYWTINESNQRVWVSENKFPLSPPSANNTAAPQSNSSVSKKVRNF
jgi:hypothetical protein